MSLRKSFPGDVLPLSILVLIRTTDFHACFSCFGRKRLQPFPQTFATALANVCNLGRKRLRLKLHHQSSDICI